MLANSWKLTASLTLAKDTSKELPVTFAYQFTKRIIRVETSIAGVLARWRTAGYLRQLINVIPAEESADFRVPLNTRKILAVPLLRSTYQLSFVPVSWLPAGLKLRIYEYNGSETDQTLMQELMLIK